MQLVGDRMGLFLGDSAAIIWAAITVAQQLLESVTVIQRSRDSEQSYAVNN